MAHPPPAQEISQLELAGQAKLQFPSGQLKLQSSPASQAQLLPEQVLSSVQAPPPKLIMRAKQKGIENVKIDLIIVGS